MTALLDTEQIAQQLGMTREYVTDRLTKRPDFPRPRINISRKMRRWAECDLREWIDRHAVGKRPTAAQR